MVNLQLPLDFSFLLTAQFLVDAAVGWAWEQKSSQASEWRVGRKDRVCRAQDQILAWQENLSSFAHALCLPSSKVCSSLLSPTGSREQILQGEDRFKSELIMITCEMLGRSLHLPTPLCISSCHRGVYRTKHRRCAKGFTGALTQIKE